MDRKGSGRLPEVGLVKALSWEFHPREDLSQPPSLRDPHFTGGWDGTEVSTGRGHGETAYHKLLSGRAGPLCTFFGRH